jgi:hypothetical protein
MTFRQWVLSGLIVWHVIAVLVRAAPTASVLPAFVATAPGAGWRGLVTSGLDAAAAAWVPASRALEQMARPLRRPTDLYLQLTGQGQNWSMFANPPRVDEYLRVRFYVQPEQGRMWMATQLVWPAGREDQLRLIQAFRDSYLDKTFAVALAEFKSHRKPSAVRPDTRPEELPDDLAPIARYYARLFRTQLRDPGERVVRTEIWAGAAPNPQPGHAPDGAALIARRAVLQAYYEGIVEQRLNVPSFPPYHALDPEADIDWVLEYFEES